MSHAQHLSPLPPRPAGIQWSPHVQNAYDYLSHSYDQAVRILLQDSEASRLRFYCEFATREMYPILREMEDHAEDEQLPKPWILSCATEVGSLVRDMCRAQEAAQTREDANIQFQEPVTSEYTGRPGRPRKHIDREALAELMSTGSGLSVSDVARALRVSRPVLLAHLKKYNILYKFSDLRKSELDAMVKSYRQKQPMSGLRYLVGSLRKQGFRVQRRRLYSSIGRVDGLGRQNRRRRIIPRGPYSVPRPHALWHIDGHHKLILWGIVIHGIVDGYSRTITGLRASTNNKASTVLDVFLEAVEEYGNPSRVRGDRGGENKKVSVYMILTRGLGRASFMWGSSTTNTRIERLWVEVGSQFARCWRAFFYRLEARHQLNRKNAQHLWLLHHLFLDLINEDCDEFRQVWNVKPISGEAHNKSPEAMLKLGQLQHGSYSAVDDYDDVHPTVLQSYYGTHGSPRTNNDTGAGQLEDEAISDADSDIEADEEESDFDPDEHSDSEAIAAAVAEAQGDNFHHEPVAVPKHECPFGDDDLQLFTRSLQAASSANMVPHGYGLLEEEWEDEGYPSFEIIKSGRRGRKELRIDLPDHIWRPRAELWGCALAILNQIGFMNES